MMMSVIKSRAIGQYQTQRSRSIIGMLADCKSEEKSVQSKRQFSSTMQRCSGARHRIAVPPTKEWHSVSELASLNNLRDNEGSRKVARRVGRGIGSSKGKTCGRGHKGQGQKSKKPNPGFEGGQT